ncbi:MAG: SMC-Scp complex subunit ScpB [Clostridia bacterium]|nr:SMC-Scp complex subunit ScpB [Clostridia bacterium]
MRKLEGALEAILFAMGDAVEKSSLCGALEIDEPQLEAVAASLSARCNGVRILEIGSCYQMSSSAQYYEYIQKILQTSRPAPLSQAALETLSIVAYNQPVTKTTIDAIRGVDCTYSVARLCERGLIDEAGRAELPGRPILYVTTMEFLRMFALRSLDDLPPLPEGKTLSEPQTEDEVV